MLCKKSSKQQIQVYKENNRGIVLGIIQGKVWMEEENIMVTLTFNI